MGNPYKKTLTNRKSTPQTSPIPGRENEMSKNNAGGYSFDVSLMTFVDRFLILGTEGGSYYNSEKTLTEAGATKVKEAIKQNGVAVVERATQVSDQGLAKSNTSAIFVLALAATHGNEATKNTVNANLDKVCRTGTHILNYVDFVANLRGFGRSVRAGINNWYSSKDSETLGYQISKYANRDGWKHSDVFRLTHPKFNQELNEKVIKHIMGKESNNKAKIIEGFELAKKSKNVKDLIKLIDKYKLPREAIPTQFLNSVEVWESLIETSGMSAIIRNLNKMTSVGLINNKPFDVNTKKINELLTNKEAIKKGRIHPLSLLMALKTYSLGRGFKGDLSWSPVSSIKNSLEEAFYLSFDYIEPSNKRILYALDVSGSMTSILPGTNISSCEITAAMSMALARSEKNHYIMGFAGIFKDLNISSKDKLQIAMKKAQDNNFGSTNCSLPFEWGMKNNVEFDMAVIMTDSETYGGKAHVTQVLKKYRDKFGLPNTKMICAAFAANNFSIADPTDPFQLDYPGVSSDLPNIVSSFAKLGD